jgi:hypothetical protein
MPETFNEDTIRLVLDLLETRELALLEIGVVDAALNHSELSEIVSSVAQSEAPIYINELLKRGLIFDLNHGYRSRMAETVRLLSHLRQAFPKAKISDAKPLVWDYRILRQPRRRPEADVPLDSLIDAIPGITELQKNIIETVAPKSRMLRNFQVLGTQEVLARLKHRSETGVMISAGTGSGKTLAFYLPTILAISEILRADESNWVKTLAVYPRTELLKDQFSSILGYVFRVSKLKGSARPIRVGAWFGETPDTGRFASDKWKKFSDGSSLVFPLAKCPQCESGDLLWRSDDRENQVERLVCSNQKCDCIIPEGMIGLTREALNSRPVDILFSSTESINRQLADSGTHKAFGFAGVERLRMVLLDEIHTYEGLTGAQNAYLMRRIRHIVRTPIVWVGLSATLTNAEDFMGQMVNLSPARIQVIKPLESELKPFGAEYSVALRHDPTQRHGVLSLTLQTAMLMARVLDPRARGIQRVVNSKGMFGKRTFIFTDKLDVTNRMYWQLMDVEGWEDHRRPKTGRGPQTLAHLRSDTQTKMDSANQENKVLRDADGQWWQISEKLGFKIDLDNGLEVTRVSSQEPGVDDKSELVVATATLEVGYSDDNVGAVIQHKAPSDSARFIQRKGRAGRSIEMRPWTVVTLSEWGRDKIAWQLYDQFLFPQVANKHLPINNRYVQRIQAVFATMDWLALRLNNIGKYRLSTRTDLIGPAHLVETNAANRQQRLKRQQKAEEILLSVLQRGVEFDSWRTHLKNALGLTDAEIDFLLVSPPRPLLLSMIPTMHRRLSTQWADEPVDPTDPHVIRRNPFLDFAPSSLFADLLSREVSVVVPSAAHPVNTSPDQNDKSLPVLRVLREFMPGNVSRHFGSKKSDRHWIEPVNSVIDVAICYKAEKVCDVILSDGSTIAMHQPTQLTLQTVPFQVQESSSSSAVWNTNFETVGSGASIVFPPQLNGSVILSAKAFVHSNGSALRVRRFTTRSNGSVVRRGQGRTGITNTFSHNGVNVALGFEYEVDAIEVNVSKVNESPLSSWELRDRAVEYLSTTTDLPESINFFDREKLGLILQAAAAYSVLGNGMHLTQLANLSDDGLFVEMEKVLPVVVGIDDVDLDDDVGDTPQMNSDAMDDMRHLLRESLVLLAIRQALKYLAGQGDDWIIWRQRRLAVTAGAGFLGACQIVVPDVDMDDLQLDIAPDGKSFIVSEMSPGGNGQIERIVEAIGEAGIAFTHAFRRQADPGETESMGVELGKTVEVLVANQTLRHEGAQLLHAWNDGQAAVFQIFTSLKQELEKSGVKVSSALSTSLTSRFLGPSGLLESIDFANDLKKEIEQISITAGFDVDFRIALWIIEELFAQQMMTKHPLATANREFRRTVEMLSWPTGRSAALYDLSPRSGFEPLPLADRQLMGDYLGKTTSEFTFKVADEEELASALIADGEVLIRVDKSDLVDLRTKLLEGLSHPIESGPMLVYPRVIGLETVGGTIRVRLSLEEGTSWDV